MFLNQWLNARTGSEVTAREPFIRFKRHVSARTRAPSAQEVRDAELLAEIAGARRQGDWLRPVWGAQGVAPTHP